MSINPNSGQICPHIASAICCMVLNLELELLHATGSQMKLQCLEGLPLKIMFAVCLLIIVILLPVVYETESHLLL